MKRADYIRSLDDDQLTEYLVNMIVGFTHGLLGQIGVPVDEDEAIQQLIPEVKEILLLDQG